MNRPQKEFIAICEAQNKSCHDNLKQANAAPSRSTEISYIIGATLAGILAGILIGEKK